MLCRLPLRLSTRPRSRDGFRRTTAVGVGDRFGDLALLRLRDTRTHCHEPGIGKSRERVRRRGCVLLLGFRRYPGARLPAAPTFANVAFRSRRRLRSRDRGVAKAITSAASAGSAKRLLGWCDCDQARAQKPRHARSRDSNGRGTCRCHRRIRPGGPWLAVWDGVPGWLDDRRSPAPACLTTLRKDEIIAGTVHREAGDVSGAG